MAGIVMDAFRYVPPLASNFATTTYGTNSENPTFTDTTGRGLVFSFGSSPASGDNVRAKTKTKPASSNYDIIARFRHSTALFAHMGGGLVVTDGTKLVTFFLGNDGGSANWGFKVDQWTNKTTFSAEPVIGFASPHIEWLRIGVVASDPKNFYISENGTDWIEVLSSSQTGFLTYTEIGIGAVVNRSSGTFPVSSTPQFHTSVLYYSDPDIVPPV